MAAHLLGYPRRSGQSVDPSTSSCSVWLGYDPCAQPLRPTLRKEDLSKPEIMPCLKRALRRTKDLHPPVTGTANAQKDLGQAA